MQNNIPEQFKLNYKLMEFINNGNTNGNGSGIDMEEDFGYAKVERYNDQSIERMQDLYHNILESIGENPNREGLQKTPFRVAKAMQFLTQGYDQNPEAILKSAIFKEDYNDMVLVKDIELYSMCEHHMLPFFGKAHIAYIPDGYITGLSKVARVVEAYSRRLQIQERLTQQIRDVFDKALKPKGVAVVIEAQHMCMQMRGVQKQNSVTTTSAFSGVFKTQETRDEFLSLIRSNLH